jgi:hypothetical protein
LIVPKMRVGAFLRALSVRVRPEFLARSVLVDVCGFAPPVATLRQTACEHAVFSRGSDVIVSTLAIGFAYRGGFVSGIASSHPFRGRKLPEGPSRSVALIELEMFADILPKRIGPGGMQRASVRRCWIGLASATACFAVPVVADRVLAERFAFVNSINRTV